MRKALIISAIMLLFLASPSFASYLYPPQTASIGVFAPRSVELCRADTSPIDSFEEIGLCRRDEVVISEEDFFSPAVPVSVELISYRQHEPAEKAVDRNIELFTGALKKNFATYLSRSGKYMRMMKGILREEGLPEDMAYLALVESGFNTRAYSRMKAAGPWQFIAGTAKRYGLKVDWWVDERRDPVKSTRAAARYLSDLYDMFGSWSLAMAAYNAGEVKIKKALDRARSGDYWGLLSTGHIRFETKNYVPSFIAATLIATNPEAYGFHDIAYEEDFVYDEVALKSPLTLDVVARCAGTTEAVIKELNPELIRWSTPPHVQNYTIRIPRGSTEKFLENLSKVPEGKRYTVEVYRVRRGDTVSSISKKTGVPQKVLISYNKLNRRGFITAGQKLLIPVGLASR